MKSVFLAVCLTLCFSQYIPETHFHKGYFKGRSSNVVAKGPLKSVSNNVVILEGIEFEEIPSSLDITDIGDIISRQFWVGKLKVDSPVKLKQNF
eukprot:UN02745